MSRSYANGVSGHCKPRAAQIGTNSRAGKALIVLPAGYARCEVCTNKARPNADRSGQLRPHRDLHGHPCYNRDAAVSA